MVGPGLTLGPCAIDLPAAHSVRTARIRRAILRLALVAIAILVALIAPRLGFSLFQTIERRCAALARSSMREKVRAGMPRWWAASA